MKPTLLIALSLCCLDPENEKGATPPELDAFISLLLPYYQKNIDKRKTIVDFQVKSKNSNEKYVETQRYKLKENILTDYCDDLKKETLSELQSMSCLPKQFFSIMEERINQRKAYSHPQKNCEPPYDTIQLGILTLMARNTTISTIEQMNIYLSFLFPGFSQQNKEWRSCFREALHNEPAIATVIVSEETGYQIKESEFNGTVLKLRQFTSVQSNFDALKASICDEDLIDVLFPGLEVVFDDIIQDQSIETTPVEQNSQEEDGQSLWNDTKNVEKGNVSLELDTEQNLNIPVIPVEQNSQEEDGQSLCKDTANLEKENTFLELDTEQNLRIAVSPLEQNSQEEDGQSLWNDTSNLEKENLSLELDTEQNLPIPVTQTDSGTTDTTVPSKPSQPRISVKTASLLLAVSPETLEQQNLSNDNVNIDGHIIQHSNWHTPAPPTPRHETDWDTSHMNLPISNTTSPPSQDYETNTNQDTSIIDESAPIRFVPPPKDHAVLPTQSHETNRDSPHVKPPLPIDIQVIYIMKVAETTTGNSGMAYEEIVMELKHNFPFYKNEDQISWLETVLNSETFSKTTDIYQISKKTKIFALSSLCHFLLHNLEEFCKSTPKIDNLTFVLPEWKNGSAKLLSKLEDETKIWLNDYCKKWDVASIIPEPLIFRLAIMCSEEKTHIKVVEFIYDNFLFYNMTKQSFGTRYEHFNRDETPDIIYKINEDDSYQSKTKLMQIVQDKEKRETLMDILPNPKILNYFLPSDEQIELNKTYERPPLANSDENETPMEAILVAIGIMHTSDEKGWASLDNIVKFVQTQFPYFSGEGRKKLKRTPAWTELFNIETSEVGEVSQSKYQIKPSKLLSIYSWIHKYISFDDKDLLKSYMKLPDFIEQILSQPPPIWKNYYSSEKVQTKPLRRPPIQVITTSQLFAKPRKVPTPATLERRNSVTQNSFIPQQSSSQQSSFTTGTNRQKPSYEHHRLIPIKLNSSMVQAPLPSRKQPFGPMVPLFSNPQKLNQSQLSISAPIPVIPRQPSENRDINDIAAADRICYDEKPLLEPHLKLSAAFILSECKKYKEENQTSYAGDNGFAPYNDVHINQFSLLVHWLVQDIDTLLEDIFPYYLNKKHVGDFFRIDFKDIRDGGYIYSEKVNLDKEMKTMHHFQRSSIADLFEDIFNVEDWSSPEKMKKWLKDPSLASLFCSGRLPFSDTTILLIALFVIGEPSNSYCHNLNDIVEFMIKEMNVNYIGVSGLPWEEDRLRDALMKSVKETVDMEDFTYFQSPQTQNPTILMKRIRTAYNKTKQRVSDAINRGSLNDNLVKLLQSLLDMESSLEMDTRVTLIPPYPRNFLIALAIKNLASSPGTPVPMDKIWGFITHYFPYYEEMLCWCLVDLKNCVNFRFPMSLFEYDESESSFTIRLSLEDTNKIMDEVCQFTHQNRQQILDCMRYGVASGVVLYDMLSGML